MPTMSLQRAFAPLLQCKIFEGAEMRLLKGSATNSGERGSPFTLSLLAFIYHTADEATYITS